ncbi:hypothetical protein LBMAG27_08340 [Bacteroidota bacterium]|nr:hypothetical protein LBMAG27_08340 [Bacteroidota bacterium]
MPYKIKSLPLFEKQSKRLIKKYPSLKRELLALIELLKTNPEAGIAIGKNCFKIRISIASKGKGKSGGARVITNIVFQNKIVFLISIYDKSEIGSLPQSELDFLLNQIKLK